jgi:hypothetical protein
LELKLLKLNGFHRLYRDFVEGFGVWRSPGEPLSASNSHEQGKIQGISTADSVEIRVIASFYGPLRDSL